MIKLVQYFVLKKFVPQLLFISVLVVLTSCATQQNRGPIRVACVGDSITYGYGIKDREHDSYPAQLAALLGEKWEVRNFGVNGATALKRGTRPYNEQPAYREVLSFKPNVVVIKLGTNDTNAKSWPSHKDEFLSDYLELIRSFAALETKPKIYLCRPVPLFRDRGKEYDTDKILVEEVIPKVNEAAKKTKLPIIDLYAPFEDKANLFPDGVHPDAKGAGIMASTIFSKLTGRSVGNQK